MPKGEKGYRSPEEEAAANEFQQNRESEEMSDYDRNENERLDRVDEFNNMVGLRDGIAVCKDKEKISKYKNLLGLNTKWIGSLSNTLEYQDLIKGKDNGGPDNLRDVLYYYLKQDGNLAIREDEIIDEWEDENYQQHSEIEGYKTRLITLPELYVDIDQNNEPYKTIDAVELSQIVQIIKERLEPSTAYSLRLRVYDKDHEYDLSTITRDIAHDPFNRGTGDVITDAEDKDQVIIDQTDYPNTYSGPTTVMQQKLTRPTFAIATNTRNFRTGAGEHNSTLTTINSITVWPGCNQERLKSEISRIIQEYEDTIKRDDEYKRNK